MMKDGLLNKVQKKYTGSPIWKVGAKIPIL